MRFSWQNAGEGKQLPLPSYSEIKVLVPLFVPPVAFEPVTAG